MVELIHDIHAQKEGIREVTLSYEVNNAHDQMILYGIIRLLNLQPRCCNCTNYKDDGVFCGYRSHSCKIHGNLEAFDHPHHDGDGSKCPNYEWNGDF